MEDERRSERRGVGHVRPGSALFRPGGAGAWRASPCPWTDAGHRGRPVNGERVHEHSRVVGVGGGPLAEAAEAGAPLALLLVAVVLAVAG